MKCEVPVRAFVTFEYEEGYNAAKDLKYEAKVKDEQN